MDQDHPVGYGMKEWTSAYFYEAQAFKTVNATVLPTSEPSVLPSDTVPVSVVARYADTALVETGIIRAGEDIIKGKPAIVEVKYGKGNIVLLGFSVNRNGQTNGTFRFLFNAIGAKTCNYQPIVFC